MTLERIQYRVWQFWQAISARPDAAGLLAAQELLGPALWEVFARLQPGEQAHSLNILRQLQALGETDHDLLTAALLHDVGKSLCPLHLWERVWIVLYNRLLRGNLQPWSGLTPHQVQSLPFWQRPLAVAACHPAWGAKLAADRAAPDLVVVLIAAHQDQNSFSNGSQAANFLTALQSVDDVK